MSITILSPDRRGSSDNHPRYNLDVVAVHGLNGDALRTWTEPRSNKLWLRDFLSLDLPGSRVMSFGYNATPAFENTTAGIREHARSLLNALIEVRGSQHEGRPLIFIGHSLGGLVIKQALILAQDEVLYSSIYNHLRGIIFFGTPHQGSSLATYATVLTRIPLILANKPDPKLLEALSRDSDALKKLTDDFRKHHETRPYDIVTFYETRTMKGWKHPIVEETSAILTPPDQKQTYEDPNPVDADHREMCRFTCREDQTYKKALISTKRLYYGKNACFGNEFFLVPDIFNSQFTGRVELSQKIDECVASCRADGLQQRIVLHGLGGSGKTQMSLKFAHDNRQKYWAVFFIDASSQERAAQGFLDIARACGVKEDVEGVKEWLLTKDNWLLIIDNCDDPAMNISQFFPSGNKGSIIVTTRNPELRRYASAGSFGIAEMSPDDATSLLLKVAAIDSTLGNKASEEAARVVNELGCLALAIIQAAAVIRQRICPLDGFCDLFKKQKKDLLESGVSGFNNDYHRSVFTTWDISLQCIETMANVPSRLALELLRVFSFMHFDGIQQKTFQRAFENSVDIQFRAVLRQGTLVQVMPNGWDGVLWGKAIAILVAFSLITVEAEGLISMHPLVHEWSRVRMTEEEESPAWKSTLVILGLSSSWEHSAAAQKYRRQLLPHIDAVMTYDNGQLYAQGSDLRDLSYAAKELMKIYQENLQFEKVVTMASEDLKSKGIILAYNSPYCIEIRFRLALAKQCLTCFEESTELYRNIITDLQGSDEIGHMIEAKIGLSRSAYGLGNYQQALDLCNEIEDEFHVISTLNSSNGYEARTLLQTMQFSNSALNNIPKALEIGIKVLENNKSRNGLDHSDTLMAMYNSASDYQLSKNYKQAWALYEQAYTLLSETLGPDHVYTRMALQQMASFGGALGASWRKKTIKNSRQYLESLRDSTKGQDPDLAVINAMTWLADDYFICGELLKAKELMGEVVKWTVVLLGEEHKDAIVARRFLKKVKITIGMRKAAYWWLPRSVKKV